MSNKTAAGEASTPDAPNAGEQAAGPEPIVSGMLRERAQQQMQKRSPPEML